MKLQKSKKESDNAYLDLPVLEGVGHPVAVHPEPRLAAIAAEGGWSVIGSPWEND